MWIYALSLICSGGLVVLGARGEGRPLAEPLVLFFAPVCAFCAWRLGAAVLLVRQARARGWHLPWTGFALLPVELATLGASRVPLRSDWETLPAHDPELPEAENLAAAIAMARGWDDELERSRRPVCVHHASSPEMAAMVAGLLRDAGFRAHADEPAPGAYRFSWGAKVHVPAREEEAARAYLEEHLGEIGESEGEGTKGTEGTQGTEGTEGVRQD